MVNKYDCIIPQTCSLFDIYSIILVYSVECSVQISVAFTVCEKWDTYY